MAGNGVIFARGGSNQSQAFQPQPRPAPVLNQATAPFFGVRNAAPSATTSTHQFDAAVGVAPTGFADVRATIATYIDDDGFVRTVAANTERVEYDPATKALLGLLVEPAATNIASYSENFAQSGTLPTWHVDAGGPFITANNLLDPRGSKTGYTVSLLSSSGQSGGVYINYTTITPGATYTFSAWVKTNVVGGTSIRLTSNNSLAWNTGISQRFTVGVNWTRISITGAISTAGTCNIGFDNRDATGTWDSLCQGNVDVWGPQLETGSSASSYISTGTSASSVTRAADAYSFTLGASQTSIQFTFDDGSTQTVSGLTGGATYNIPTTLNRSHILYWDDAAGLASSGAAAGDNTATAVGAWLQSGDGSATGTNTTTAIAAPIQAEPGTSAGTDTATGVGHWLQSGDGASAGANTSSATGTWLQSGVGSAAGVNTSSATAAPIQAKVGSATGANTVAGVGAWLQSGVGSSAGSNTSSATAAPIQAKVGSATGTDTATGIGAWLQSGVGSSSGSNTATATGTKLQAGVGSSAGSNTTTAIGSWLQSGVGNAAGSNFATGYSAAVANVGTSSGSNTATAVGSWLQSGVGSSSGSNATTAVGSWTAAGSVGASFGASTAVAVGAWTQSGVGTSAGGNIAVAGIQADFSHDFAQDFAGFPGSLGIGGDFSQDFSGDFPVVHGGQEFNSDFSSDFPALGIANIRSGIGSSAGSNIASGVSSVIVVEPPVVPEPEPIPLQVWQPAAEYRKVQAPRATRVFRTGTDLRRAAPSSMTRINRTGTEMRRSTSRSMKRQYG